MVCSALLKIWIYMKSSVQVTSSCIQYYSEKMRRADFIVRLFIIQNPKMFVRKISLFTMHKDYNIAFGN
jgi:hypothetical protein